MSGRVVWLSSAFCGGLALLLCLWVVPGLATRATEPGSVIISEVAWGGTAAGATHEWLELYNSTGAAIDLTGWTLEDDGLLAILSGVIGAHDFYFLERNDFALIDIASDAALIGQLANEGEAIRLLDQETNVVDTANQSGGSWPAGTAGEFYYSMERADPLGGDDATNWENNDGLTRNGLDANAQPVNGTPGQPNSGWAPPGQPNLVLGKLGPDQADPGSTIHYVLAAGNTGPVAAVDVVLTDTLPPSTTYTAQDGQFPFNMPTADTAVWQIGTIEAGLTFSINVTVTLDLAATGILTNIAEISTPIPESEEQDNSSIFVSQIAPPESVVLIDAVYYDGYELQDHDEGVRLINVGGGPADISDWRLSDGVSEAIFPQGTVLAAGEAIWVTDYATSFRRQFGEDPAYEVRGDDPLTPNLAGTWPGFSNDGDEVLLMSASGSLQDVVVYKDGKTNHPGWSGPAVSPYAVTSVFAEVGQILYRQRNPAMGEPVPDTDTAGDWAQFEGDVINGRRVRYPGWDLERFYASEWFTETAEFVIGIAPDNAYELLQSELAGADSTIQIMSHTFRSAAIAQDLAAAAQRGVTVTVLLEGQPVGGIEIDEQQACDQLSAAGGQCWFMINDEDERIYDRYRYLHAKFIIVDGRRAIISTENLSPDSMPDGDKSDGVVGRRGVLLATDAPAFVSRLQAIWDADFDIANHIDLASWPLPAQSPGEPRRNDRQLRASGALSYSVRYTEPTVLSGEFGFAVVQSPENSLDAVNGLLPLLARAGPGDTILVEQLVEKPHWGPSNSNPQEDPNPRLTALINAARRGAMVRLLLDSFFDDDQEPDSNEVTCQQINSAAAAEDLNLQCELTNPTGLGLHNKMVLANIGGRGYVFAGSVNGTELSHKGNREVALLLQSDAAYEFLAEMFMSDWPHIVRMPLIFNNYLAPARHLLISEVFYDPPGLDDAEFVELFNPTPESQELSGWSLGDAVQRSDFEDVRRFPAGTHLEGGATLVIASTASGFDQEFGFKPDFEIYDSDWSVPDLVDDKSWGDPAAILQLANGGDEVILRDPEDRIVDAVAYGTGSVTGNVSCELLTLSGASLERYPPWRDTNHCPQDFREWPFPNPGAVP